MFRLMDGVPIKPAALSCIVLSFLRVVGAIVIQVGGKCSFTILTNALLMVERCLGRWEVFV